MAGNYYSAFVHRSAQPRCGHRYSNRTVASFPALWPFALSWRYGLCYRLNVNAIYCGCAFGIHCVCYRWTLRNSSRFYRRSVSVFVGAGFLDGLVTGLLSGTLAWWLSTRRVPALISSLMPVVIVPLISSLLVGLIMFLVLGKPLSLLLLSLQNWLAGLSGSSAIILGAVLGLMMCFDLGGPVNKAAYLFATAGLSTIEPAALHIMAAAMVAGMVPPIALSLATIMDKKVFTDTKREKGKSVWLLGLSFISEGAIPFAAGDPLKVIPSLMIGGASAGAISMGTATGSHAPHGGIFVLFAISPAWTFLLALLIGVIVSALIVILLKRMWLVPIHSSPKHTSQYR